MFDIWYGDIELTRFTLIVSVVFLIPLQLFLCFKVKSLFIRLFPVTLLGTVGGWFLILCFGIDGWDSIGYAILAILAGFMLLACALGWGVWLICHWREKKQLQ